MTYAPATLLELRRYLMPKTGLTAGNLGIVGDAAHATRASYHNGWDRITAAGRTAATDYTIRTARDRAEPRTAAAMAMDIGNHHALRSLSAYLVRVARLNAPGTRDMREIIYSPDGVLVLRWDRERGYDSLPRRGEADDSHRWHTHVSWYRDSERRDKVNVFRGFYEPLEQVAYIAHVIGRTMTYDGGNRELGEVSGFTIPVAERVKMGGQWRYRILTGKYRGRYLPATSTVQYTRPG